MEEPNSKKNPKLIPLVDWHKFHQYPPLGQLRNLVFHAKTNGFDKVVVRASGRVLLNEDAWYDWLAERNPSFKGGQS